MDTETFMAIVSQSQKRDVEVLIKKGEEYTVDGDRLAQFYKAADIKLSDPISELLGMATKHFTSIVMMAADPEKFQMEMWEEKTTDLRNYMHLLEALLVDMRSE